MSGNVLTRSRRGRRRGSVGVLAAVLLLSAACSSDGDEQGRGSTPTAAPSSASGDQSQATVRSLIDTGLAQLEDQRYAEATTAFETVIDLDPTNAYGWYNLGYLAELQDDEATAVQRYTTALGHDKEFAPAIYNLAILTESSDLEAAVELYRRGVDVKPDDSAAFMRLGFALRHLGQEAEAQRMLDRGIELDPSMADVSSPVYP